jgi:hypothetical protein
VKLLDIGATDATIFTVMELILMEESTGGSELILMAWDSEDVEISGVTELVSVWAVEDFGDTEDFTETVVSVWAVEDFWVTEDFTEMPVD